MNEIKYNENEIAAIRNSLPHGSYQEIAEECSYSREYVSRVFNSKVRCNNTIIAAAKAIIRREAARDEEIAKRIEGKAA